MYVHCLRLVLFSPLIWRNLGSMHTLSVQLSKKLKKNPSLKKEKKRKQRCDRLTAWASPIWHPLSEFRPAAGIISWRRMLPSPYSAQETMLARDIWIIRWNTSEFCRFCVPVETELITSSDFSDTSKINITTNNFDQFFKISISHSLR